MTMKEQDDRNTAAAKLSKLLKDHSASVAPIDRITNREYYAQFDAEYLMAAYADRGDSYSSYSMIRWLFCPYKPENGLRLLLTSDRFDTRNFADVLLGIVTGEVPPLRLTTLTQDEMSALLCNVCRNNDKRLAAALFTPPAPVELAGPKTFAQAYSQYRPERGIVDAFFEHMLAAPTEYVRKKSRLTNIARWLFEPRDTGELEAVIGALGNRIPDDAATHLLPRLAGMRSAADVTKAVTGVSPGVYEFTEIFGYLMASIEAKRAVPVVGPTSVFRGCGAVAAPGGTFAQPEAKPMSTEDELRAALGVLFA